MAHPYPARPSPAAAGQNGDMNDDSSVTPGSPVVIAGASGLIGSALTRSLTEDGHEVLRLVRRAPRAADEVRWDPEAGRIDAAALEGCAAVVNLAGAGVASHRWTKAYKATIRRSRVSGTATLARAVASLDRRPSVFVNGSAIGYYGLTGDREVDESAPAGAGFLPELCVEWEGAADPASQAGIRTVFTRTGLVVAQGGGAWGPLFPLFKAGVGGRMGDGRQYWSFISLYDEIAALRHLISTPSLSGPFNLTAPTPLTNRDITRAMGKVLHRPTVFTVPAPALRLVLGEVSGDVLGSTRAVPARLLESGFTFTFPDIEDAIRSAVGRRPA